MTYFMNFYCFDKNDKKWPKMPKNDRNDKNDKKWPKMTKNDKKCQKMTRMTKMTKKKWRKIRFSTQTLVRFFSSQILVRFSPDSHMKMPVHLRSHQKRLRKWPEPKKSSFWLTKSYIVFIFPWKQRFSWLWGLWVADLQVYLKFVRKALKWKFR